MVTWKGGVPNHPEQRDQQGKGANKGVEEDETTRQLIPGEGGRNVRGDSRQRN